MPLLYFKVVMFFSLQPRRTTSSATGDLYADEQKAQDDDKAKNLRARQEAIPGLLNPHARNHVLRSEHFDDPADLARLPAVSRVMRDAVAATGLRFEELGEMRAMDLGCLSAVQRLERGGRLSRRERLCEAAARSGQLEKLQVLRARTARRGTGRRARRRRGAGTSRTLQWARANGCP